METKRSFKESLLRIVALMGLLLVLLLGAWGIILVALNLPTIAGSVGTNIVSLFSFSGTSGDESLNISAPEAATSGTPFTLGWAHENKPAGEYAYTISYECKNGITVKAPSQTNGYQTVPCATPFNYTGASDRMPLIVTTTGSLPMTATFVVAASKVDDGQVTSTGSANVIVNRTGTSVSNPPSTNTGNTPQSNYVPAATQPKVLHGYADLKVTMLSVNSLSVVQGRTAVQFEIKNVGTNVAPAGWTFEAKLPVEPVYTYYTNGQQALYPGDKIVYTLTFDRPQNQYCTLQYPNPNCPPQYQYPYQNQSPTICYRYDGYQNVPVPCTDADGYPVYQNPNYNTGNYYVQNLITVIVDPRNYIPESNEANNTASIAVPWAY